VLHLSELDVLLDGQRWATDGQADIQMDGPPSFPQALPAGSGFSIAGAN